MKSFKLENGGADNNLAVGGLLSLIIFGGIAWYYFGGGMETQTKKILDDVNKKVSADVVQQYEIAKRQGDKIQICVQAGIVSAAYLQEKNEASYRQWKAIEKADCSSAGINR
jgi:hypothetical protein